MDVIHFTRGATDPLTSPTATHAHYLPLADGHGDAHLSCAHLDPGAQITAPPTIHVTTLLIVHGRITLTRAPYACHIDVAAGMGCVFQPDEAYALESPTGAILLILETDALEAHPRGISTPQRIAGARWAGDDVSP